MNKMTAENIALHILTEFAKNGHGFRTGNGGFNSSLFCKTLEELTGQLESNTSGEFDPRLFVRLQSPADK